MYRYLLLAQRFVCLEIVILKAHALNCMVSAGSAPQIQVKPLRIREIRLRQLALCMSSHELRQLHEDATIRSDRRHSILRV